MILRPPAPSDYVAWATLRAASRAHLVPYEPQWAHDELTRADFGGKLLVLHFWATWCGGCVEEIPSLEVFQREYGPQGVVVLAVSVDANEQLYKRFMSQFNVAYSTSRDPSWDIAASYGTFQLPESYIIDSSGKVVQKVIAAQNWQNPEFVQSLKKLL